MFNYELRLPPKSKSYVLSPVLSIFLYLAHPVFLAAGSLSKINIGKHFMINGIKHFH